MSPIDCFFIEPTGKVVYSLRRYANIPKGEPACASMPGEYSYHNANVLLSVEDERDNLDHPHDDPRWPKHCACGYEFKESDNWQLFNESQYVRKDTGETMTLRNAPAGAMWFADWMTEGRDDLDTNRLYVGPDDRCLVVKTPGGSEWMIDSRASNCTMPDDKMHKCWIRHGVVPKITVDKNGKTCAAGGGSILTANWHGFLRDGRFIDC